jgi:hypothetical protein
MADLLPEQAMVLENEKNPCFGDRRVFVETPTRRRRSLRLRGYVGEEISPSVNLIKNVLRWLPPPL